MSALQEPEHPVSHCLEEHLQEQLEKGDQFFKSRYVASELEFTPSEIGAAFGRLQEQSDELDIEKWSYTNGTTWKVTLGD